MFDGCCLDFCCMYRTCKDDIRKVLERLNVGPNGAPFLLTVFFGRGAKNNGEPDEERTRSLVQEMFKNASFNFTLKVETQFRSSEVYTWQWKLYMRKVTKDEKKTIQGGKKWRHYSVW